MPNTFPNIFVAMTPDMIHPESATNAVAAAVPEAEYSFVRTMHRTTSKASIPTASNAGPFFLPVAETVMQKTTIIPIQVLEIISSDIGNAAAENCGL